MKEGDWLDVPYSNISDLGGYTNLNHWRMEKLIIYKDDDDDEVYIVQYSVWILSLSQTCQ